MWMALFGFPLLKMTFGKFKERWKSGSKVNDQYTDQLNVLMRSYDEVPLWWFFLLFLTSFVIIITILAKGYLYIPIWTYFIALATGAIVVVVRSNLVLTPTSNRTDYQQPLGWLFAVSNFQLVSIPLLPFLPANLSSPSAPPTNSSMEQWSTRYRDTNIQLVLPSTAPSQEMPGIEHSICFKTRN